MRKYLLTLKIRVMLETSISIINLYKKLNVLIRRKSTSSTFKPRRNSHKISSLLKGTAKGSFNPNRSSNSFTKKLNSKTPSAMIKL
jgi:hypothetical protein